MKEGRRVIFSKKSQSEIITTVLIILLVLAAIIIVWNVVSNLISDSAEEIESQSNPSIIRVKEFILYPNNSTDIKIIHISGSEIDGLEFIFENSKGETNNLKLENLNIQSKETKTYRFTQNQIGIKDVNKVTVIPIYNSNIGISSTKEVKNMNNPNINYAYCHIKPGGFSATSFSDSVVLYMPLDGDTNDNSGNGNDGIIRGDVTSNSSGKLNGAYTFDGNGDWIELGPISIISGIASKNFTLCSWFITNGTEEDIISNGYGLTSDGDYLLMSFQTKLRGHVWYDMDSNTIDSNAVVNNNVWHHGCQVVNSTDITLYVDGVFDKTNTLSGSEITSSGNVIIGSRAMGAASNNFEGSIDELIIFNKNLDSTEIAGLYNCYY